VHTLLRKILDSDAIPSRGAPHPNKNPGSAPAHGWLRRILKLQGWVGMLGSAFVEVVKRIFTMLSCDKSGELLDYCVPVRKAILLLSILSYNPSLGSTL